jgi:hypothetical protein
MTVVRGIDGDTVTVTQARPPCRFLVMTSSFVPDHFQPPLTLRGDGFRLEPLGPRHNERDHEAWMSSIEWIQSTPGFGPDGDWPAPMNLDSNLEDLEMHARDFDQRSGFTYSVLDGDEIIGCVYIYPVADPDHDASIRSWVSESRSEMDIPVYRAVAGWIEGSWPFHSVQYAPRPRA